MMDPSDYPADKVMAFRKAQYYSDLAMMRKLADGDPELFRKLRERNIWIVCNAATESSPEAVRTLIDLGADIDEQDSNGSTGLCWAVTRGRYDVAKVTAQHSPVEPLESC